MQLREIERKNNRENVIATKSIDLKNVTFFAFVVYVLFCWEMSTDW